MAENGGEGHSRQLELNDLPDEILVRILSLLPTKSAVRTCLLLNKGLQHLCKSLTRLEFREDRWFPERNDKFINFVERVMDLHDNSVPLLSFSLKCRMKRDDADRIQTWIDKAVQSNVEDLTLSNFYDSDDNDDDDYADDDDDVICYKMRTLPRCILECQCLVKLDLDSIQFRIPSSAICFPRLKYLRLSCIDLDDDTSTMMLPSSPLLEVLTIISCYFWSYIHVCCLKLQVLTIWDRFPNGRYNRVRLCIVADSLKYFSYTGDLISKYQICASSSTQLTKVEIFVDLQMFRDLGHNCYIILKGLSGTRNLALSDYLLEGLQNSSELLDTLPIFECLTRLDIRVYENEMSIDNLMLMKIYERCPHLEYLNIEKLSHTKGNLQLSSIPLCFQTSLKKILVHHYVPGDDKADTAIDVLLNSALVLEELVVHCLRDEAYGVYEGGPKIQELQDRLNRLPRVSKNCVISARVSWSSHYSDYYVNVE